MKETGRKHASSRPSRGVLTVFLVLAAIWACGIAVWRLPSVRQPAGSVEAWSGDGSADAHLALLDAPSAGGLSFVVRVRNPLGPTLLGRLTFAPQSLYVRVRTDGLLQLKSAEPAASGLLCLLAARDARAWVGTTLAEIGKWSGGVVRRVFDLSWEVEAALSSAAREQASGRDAKTAVPGVGSTHVPFEVLNSAGVWVTEMDARSRGLLLLEVGPYCGQCLDVLDGVVSFLLRRGSAYPRLVLLVRGRAADLGRLESHVGRVRADYVLDPGGAVARTLLGSDGTAACVLMDSAGIVRFSGSAMDRSNALLEAVTQLVSGTGRQGA